LTRTKPIAGIRGDAKTLRAAHSKGEGPPDIVMVVEAGGRRLLAELTIEALSSVENMTGDLQLLPVAANAKGSVPIIAVRANKSRNTMTGSSTGGHAETRLKTMEKEASSKVTVKREVKFGVEARTGCKRNRRSQGHTGVTRR